MALKQFFWPCLDKYVCGGLTFDGCQMPTEAAPSLLSSVERGRGNITKCSWIEIRAGKDHLPISIMGKTDLTLGKLIYYQSNQGRNSEK